MPSTRGIREIGACRALIIGILGVIGLLLAALGVYSVMSLLVTERRREIAIRMALGSSNAASCAWCLAAVSARVGRCLRGRPAGIHPTAFLSSIFLGLRAFDPSVVGGAAALLATVAIVASWWPARRGMQVNPMVTLNR